MASRCLDVQRNLANRLGRLGGTAGGPARRLGGTRAPCRSRCYGSERSEGLMHLALGSRDGFKRLVKSRRRSYVPMISTNRSGRLGGTTGGPARRMGPL